MRDSVKYLQAMKLRTLIRSFFVSRGFIECETPILVPTPGMEPNLFPFETELVEFNGTKHRAGLITSPEYGLKKLLGQGLAKIFELARVFRNHEPFDETHNHEFTMLEWYRKGEGYEAIMDDIEALVKYCAEGLDASAPMNSSMGASWERITVDQAFQKYCHFSILENLDRDKLALRAKDLGIEAPASDSFDDIFFRIFLRDIEPHLGKDKPTILYEYPASMAALARTKPSDPRVAERFEVYINGLELANAYGELTDPIEQRARFEKEQQERTRLGKTVFPIDEALLAELPKIGQAAGIALGVDRLAMLLTGAKSIEEVIGFSARELFSKEKFAEDFRS